MLQDAVAEGRQLLHMSLQTFRDVMDSGESDSARVTAARSAIEYTLKITEQADILERIEALESEVERF